MSTNAQNSGLAILTPMCKGVGGHFIKTIMMQVHEISRSGHKTSCLSTPYMGRMEPVLHQMSSTE